MASIKESFLLITPSEDSSLNIQNNYNFYLFLTNNKKLILFPEAQDLKDAGRQIEILIDSDRAASIICSAKAIKKPFKSAEDLCSDTLTVKKYKEIQRQTIIDWLVNAGYRSVSLVVEKGEFSARNYIIDL
ncbi:MAG: hypothetical protein HQK93_02200, partial [Nitrospirae bacterium]|nr:hypothetical protein [Nitrospirota bacterium]